MSGFKLYEIDEMLREALDQADEFIDQETGEVPVDWADFLDDIQMERDAKALNVARYLKTVKAEAEAIQAEERVLAKRRKTLQKKADRLNLYLASHMQIGEKLRDQTVSISWRKSKSVFVADPDKLPDDCVKIERTPMKTAIKERLDELPYEVAHMEEQHHLIIK